MKTAAICRVIKRRKLFTAEHVKSLIFDSLVVSVSWQKFDLLSYIGSSRRSFWFYLQIFCLELNKEWYISRILSYRKNQTSRQNNYLKMIKHLTFTMKVLFGRLILAQTKLPIASLIFGIFTTQYHSALAIIPGFCQVI